MSRSLLLDATTWDLCLDASRNIAVAADPYATAQDVACAIRTFAGEVYYDTTQGVPYLTSVFAGGGSVSTLKAQLVRAALSVPNVAAAKAFLALAPNREVGGQVQFTTQAGQTFAIGGESLQSAFVLGSSVLGEGDEI